MRKIKRVIVHCSATEGDVDANTIRDWHKARGWSDIGYHYVIRTSGAVEPGRPIEKAGAHCKGHNWDSIGICLAGGRDGTANYTPQQWRSLRVLVEYYELVYDCSVHGHNDYTDLKTCPNFNVSKWHYTDEVA